MSTNIFVNIATTDLERAKAFYTGLGATINPHFTDDNAACLVWSDDVYFMVLKREFMSTFTEKEIGDPTKTTTALVSLSRDSRDDVDAAVAAATSHGGRELREPQDYGFMYSRDIEDPDGNEVGFLWMDPKAAEIGPEAYMAEQAQA